MSVYQNPKAPKVYSTCMEKAVSDFLAGDKQVMARCAGASYDPGSDSIETVFIGRPYSIDCSTGAVQPKGHATELQGIESSVVLHNLIVASGRELSGRLVTFADFRKVGRAGGPGMKKNVTNAFIQYFGSQPELLYQLLEEFPGERTELGDASIKVNLCPRVPVVFTIWAGEDDIIPPECTVLFDAYAQDYLPLEDLAALPDFAMAKFNNYVSANKLL